LSVLAAITTMFFSLQGRMARAAFWGRLLMAGVLYTALRDWMSSEVSATLSLALLPPLLACLYSLLTRRLHDRGYSEWALLAVGIPVLGPLWLVYQTCLARGTPGENPYGPDPLTFDLPPWEVRITATPKPVGSAPGQTSGTELALDDVSGSHATPVWALARPTSLEEVCQAVARSEGPISVGGGHFSMGGQTLAPDSLHLDMRSLNRVLYFSPEERVLRVQAGIRWYDIQEFLDPHGLSVLIMQSYANFTVGGSLSVNVHGRYIGLGPIVLSVRALTVVLPMGQVVEATPELNPELFYGVIGGYGALGIIVEAELDLADNVRMRRSSKVLPTSQYLPWFYEQVRDRPEVIFHNADLYGPHCTRLRAISWTTTTAGVTTHHRLRRHSRVHPAARYFLWAITETPWGRWRREHLLDPVRYSLSAVHWRNFEAGEDVGELAPLRRGTQLFVLQEYFVPIAEFEPFAERLREILSRHQVKVVNISVRHAHADPGTLLAWARGETLAFVLYYKQDTDGGAREQVAVWTRELIDAALASGGSYYLPYQIHATSEQFHRAYPRAHELFAFKRQLDPGYRLRNALWDAYYAPTLSHTPSPSGAAPVTTPSSGAGANAATQAQRSQFHAIYDDTRSRDGFFHFLHHIFHLYPEQQIHALIREACHKHVDDESIYRLLLQRLPALSPSLGALTYALPALARQKAEMTRQTLELLQGRPAVHDYLEIGSAGRYVSRLKKHLTLSGRVYLIDEQPPGYSPTDIAERGQLTPYGRWYPLGGYAPLTSAIPDASLDLVTCYIGLHHIPLDLLDGFVHSIARVLRPNGLFVLRDHDVDSPTMFAMASLAHAVFNAGLGVSWEANQREVRNFGPVSYWVERLAHVGLVDTGARQLQYLDPSLNVLMAFTKSAAPSGAPSPPESSSHAFGEPAAAEPATTAFAGPVPTALAGTTGAALA
jgi:FAD/FMN-containing dehydrogenase/uncharacterized membrane protein YhaH (DUF805 family)/SAM-dependent methyltransferase